MSVAAKLAGHSLAVATRYGRRGDEAKKRAVVLLHVPYRRRAYLPLIKADGSTASEPAIDEEAKDG